jgi:hypothetical protein
MERSTKKDHLEKEGDACHPGSSAYWHQHENIMKAGGASAAAQCSCLRHIYQDVQREH